MNQTKLNTNARTLAAVHTHTHTHTCSLGDNLKYENLNKTHEICAVFCRMTKDA